MRKTLNQTFENGFTLIELILAVSILAILAAVIIVGINPAKQLAKSRDSQRAVDVYTILSAIQHYESDYDGAWPIEITSSEKEICLNSSVDCTDLYNLSILTMNQEYLESMPIDPLCVGDNTDCGSSVGYALKLTPAGKIIVTAPRTELGDIIFVSH